MGIERDMGGTRKSTSRVLVIDGAGHCLWPGFSMQAEAGERLPSLSGSSSRRVRQARQARQVRNEDRGHRGNCRYIL